MKEIDVLLLAHNERETIEGECKEILERLKENGWRASLFVAEDGSTDGTSEILSNLERLKVLYHVTSGVRQGYKKALLNGFKATSGERLLFLDAGRKFDLKEVVSFLNSEQDREFAVAWRKNRSDSFLRRAMTKIYNLAIRILFPRVKLHDCDSGLRLYSRRILRDINKQNFLFPDLVSSEMVIRYVYAGVSVNEYTVSYFGRKNKSRSFTLTKLFKVASVSIFRLLHLRLRLFRKTENFAVFE